LLSVPASGLAAAGSALASGAAASATTSAGAAATSATGAAGAGARLPFVLLRHPIREPLQILGPT